MAVWCCEGIWETAASGRILGLEVLTYTVDGLCRILNPKVRIFQDPSAFCCHSAQSGMEGFVFYQTEHLDWVYLHNFLFHIFIGSSGAEGKEKDDL